MTRVQLEPKAWEIWVGGWARIADGLVRVCSLGHIKPELTLGWVLYRLGKRSER